MKAQPFLRHPMYETPENAGMNFGVYYDPSPPDLPFLRFELRFYQYDNTTGLLKHTHHR
jgi:hypothetical protein